MGVMTIDGFEASESGSFYQLDGYDRLYVGGEAVTVRDFVDGADSDQEKEARLQQANAAFQETFRSAGWTGNLAISSSLGEFKAKLLQSSGPNPPPPPEPPAQ